jgi:hypothetical protein
VKHKIKQVKLGPLLYKEDPARILVRAQALGMHLLVQGLVDPCSGGKVESLIKVRTMRGPFFPRTHHVTPSKPDGIRAD